MCVCVSVVGSEPEEVGVLMGTALCLRKLCFLWGSSNCSPIAAVKPPTWRGLFSWEALVWEAEGAQVMAQDLFCPYTRRGSVGLDFLLQVSCFGLPCTYVRCLGHSGHMKMLSLVTVSP